MIGVTGATGKLGRLVINGLLQSVAPSQVVAIVRDPSKADEFAQKGVSVRYGDYNQPESLDRALTGVKRLLLISSNDMGRRVGQHLAVIHAAQAVGTEFIAYTSLLHLPTSSIPLRIEHIPTEQTIVESGMSYALLRNGFYIENYIATCLEYLDVGIFKGAYGDGRISAATRADFAAAAVKVLLPDTNTGSQAYELAGDDAFNFPELTAEISRLTGQTLAYQNVSEEAYKSALLAKGKTDAVASRMSGVAVGVAAGELFDDSHVLSKLIDRPTTPWKAALANAINERNK